MRGSFTCSCSGVREEMTKKVEIYALTDPATGETRYIGKANDAQKRFKSHLSETRRKTPVYCWIGSLRAKGQVPGLKIIAVCDQADWKEVEKSAIADSRQTNAKLLNVAEGGDEPFCSKEVRAENARKAVKARASTPLKAYIWKRKKQLAQLLSGGYGSNETRELLRQAAIVRPDIFGCFATLRNRDESCHQITK